MQVYFPLLDEQVDVSSDATVGTACDAVGLPLNLVCGGNGTCKKCLVTIKENGNVQEVLGCQYPVSEKMEIFISRERAASQILETTSNSDLPFDPHIKCYSLNYSDLVTPMCTYDLDVLRKLIPQSIEAPAFSILKQLSEVYFLKEYTTLHVIFSGNKIIDFIPSNDEKCLYGVAFDIGTTSVVGYLYDLINGCLVNQYSMLNKQISYGGDVISRIDYAGTGTDELHKIHGAIMDTLAEIINALCQKSEISTKDIYATVYCGNSTMAHLFLGLNPKHLGLAPFIGFSKDAVSMKGAELPLPVNPKGTITFMPLLGGFVGADTTSVLLGLPRDKKMRLMIDLGTNGEIAVGNCDKYYVASTACGPALEGAGLTMGMRGTAGAIEKVNCVDGIITCKVIGKTAPKGFCGSGIVDAIAMLFKEGLIAKRGNFIKGDALEAHKMKDRFGITEEKQRYFIIVRAEDNPDGKDIIITQKDIRAVQLAKAAIYTGCCLLAENFGIKGSDLEEIVIAGAFGNYIDVYNAQYIGLLPKIENVPVRSIGNGAGTGAQLYLLSQQEAAVCNAIPDITTHIELATDPKFTETYMMNTMFGDNVMM